MTFRIALQCFLKFCVETEKSRVLACDKLNDCPLLVQGVSDSLWKWERVISREEDDAFLFCDWKRWSAVTLSAVGAFLWPECLKLSFLGLAKRKKKALDIAWVLKHVDNDASGAIHVEYSRKWSFIAFAARQIEKGGPIYLHLRRIRFI